MVLPLQLHLAEHSLKIAAHSIMMISRFQVDIHIELTFHE